MKNYRWSTTSRIKQIIMRKVHDHRAHLRKYQCHFTFCFLRHGFLEQETAHKIGCSRPANIVHEVLILELNIMRVIKNIVRMMVRKINFGGMEHDLMIIMTTN